MPFRDRFFNVMWKKIHPENHHKKYDKAPQTERMKNRRSHGTEITFLLIYAENIQFSALFCPSQTMKNNHRQKQTKSKVPYKYF